VLLDSVHRKVLPRRVALGERNFQVAPLPLRICIRPSFIIEIRAFPRRIKLSNIGSHQVILNFRWPPENFIIARARESFSGDKTLD